MLERMQMNLSRAFLTFSVSSTAIEISEHLVNFDELKNLVATVSLMMRTTMGTTFLITSCSTSNKVRSCLLESSNNLLGMAHIVGSDA